MIEERVKGLNEEEINENSRTNPDPACTSCLDSTLYFSSCRCVKNSLSYHLKLRFISPQLRINDRLGTLPSNQILYFQNIKQLTLVRGWFGK